MPAPFLIDIERKAKVRYLPLTRQEIRNAAPGDAGTLRIRCRGGLRIRTLRRRYDTVGLFNFAVAHKDLPNDLVTAIVDTVFANNERMIEFHPAAAENDPLEHHAQQFHSVTWWRGQLVSQQGYARGRAIRTENRV